MSFSKTVYGLQRGIPDSDLESITGFYHPEFFLCENAAGDNVQCKECGNTTASTTMPIAARAVSLFPSADLFAVSLYISGPVVSGGYTSCAVDTGPYESPCAGDDPASIDRYVSGGTTDYVSTAGVPVAYPDASASGVFANDTVTTPTFAEAYMVNPAPTWPVPDFTGNTFGSVLFEPGDLPTNVTVTLDVHSHNQGAQCSVFVGITPYVITELPPRDAPFMCVL